MTLQRRWGRDRRPPALGAFPPLPRGASAGSQLATSGCSHKLEARCLNGHRDWDVFEESQREGCPSYRSLQLGNKAPRKAVLGQLDKPDTGLVPDLQTSAL